MEEDNILKMIFETESWEDMIYSIVNLENIDPWDVDITKLTNSFVNYIEKMKTLDFRIPAKVVIVASLLLKLKCEIFSPYQKVSENKFYGNDFDEEIEKLKEQSENIELKSPIKRKPKRKVTLDELIGALKKAIEVKETKEKGKLRLKRKIHKNINKDEIDIELRIENLLSQIDDLMTKIDGNEKVEFSKMIETWDSDKIITNFLPLLHLSNRGKVTTEQKQFFDEIYIYKLQEKEKMK